MPVGKVTQVNWLSDERHLPSFPILLSANNHTVQLKKNVNSEFLRTNSRFDAKAKNATAPIV